MFNFFVKLMLPRQISDKEAAAARIAHKKWDEDKAIEEAEIDATRLEEEEAEANKIDKLVIHEGRLLHIKSNDQ